MSEHSFGVRVAQRKELVLALSGVTGNKDTPCRTVQTKKKSEIVNHTFVKTPQEENADFVLRTLFWRTKQSTTLWRMCLPNDKTKHFRI